VRLRTRPRLSKYRQKLVGQSEKIVGF
jgi:hypothetical protein